MGEPSGADEVVNWDGILTREERARILARINSAFGAVGAQIPDTVEVGGRTLRLREIVFEYLEKDRLTESDVEAAIALSEALREQVRRLKLQIGEGELDESAAVALMKEVLGILRALEHLGKLNDPLRSGPKKEHLLSRVDDERRWLRFIKRVRRGPF